MDDRKEWRSLTFCAQLTTFVFHHRVLLVGTPHAFWDAESCTDLARVNVYLDEASLIKYHRTSHPLVHTFADEIPLDLHGISTVHAASLEEYSHSQADS